MAWFYEVNLEKAEQLAAEYAAKKDCDVILMAGYLGPHTSVDLQSLALVRKTLRKEVLILLHTFGGSPHAAYGVGRFLQNTYGRVRIFVPTQCKSAGTLLAVAAHELLMTDLGELGPIDIQQTKYDQWDPSSGLVESAATEALEEIVCRLFIRLVDEIKQMGRVTFKTASGSAAAIVAGAMSPIYAQIDPLRLGEATRGLQISEKYAQRLNEGSKNLKTNDGAVDKLVRGYPDHGFVIDRQEAATIFERVGQPCEALMDPTPPRPARVILPRAGFHTLPQR